MTTLISYQSSGGDQGRCDAKCYDAEHPDCDCICGGRNHGAGLEKATDNTRELAESWLERARANGQDITHAELAVTAMHEPLFDLGASREPPEPKRAQQPPRGRCVISPSGRHTSCA